MNTAKREKSSQAQVAAICKKYLKSLGVKCTAKSDSFSMGDSVSVSVEDQPPELMEKIEKELNQYQYGHFDGMSDMYEYSNSRKDIPQTKYLSISNHYSSEIYQAGYSYIINKYPSNCEDMPRDYESGKNMRFTDNCPAYMDMSHEVYVLLNGSGSGIEKENSVEFWTGYLKPVASEVASVGKHSQHDSGLNIEVREGTKQGFSEIVFNEKPNEDIRNKLKANGFRWSRYNGCWYGKTENLPEFAELKEDTKTESQAIKKPVIKNGDKFRTMADKLQPQIENKFADRQTNTQKRIAQAAHARLEGERLERTQKALYKIADLIESDNLPTALNSINSKKAVYDLMSAQLESVENGYHSYSYDTGKPSSHHIENPISIALWTLLDDKSQADKDKEALTRKIQDLQFSKIPGYFPTPEKVIDLMIDYADLDSGHIVLEPELGSCAIADRIAPLVDKVEGFEVNHSLAEICSLKGYLLKQADFLKVNTPNPVSDYKKYDRIMMNPPFERLQDCEHVLHAFRFLKDGGKLLAIMSPSFTFNSSKKAVSFKNWLENKGGMIIELPEHSFKDSGTCVNTVLVVIDKDLF